MTQAPNFADAVEYLSYDSKSRDEAVWLPQIRALIAADLSEPYSVYVYRYFLYGWPSLCWVARDPTAPPTTSILGIIICKLEPHAPKSATAPAQAPAPGSVPSDELPPGPSHPSPSPNQGTQRGYIAMLAVSPRHRHQRIGTRLASCAIRSLAANGAEEVVLETECSNVASLKLYEGLGFVRLKKLARYYLNGNAAFRLGLGLVERKVEDGRSREGLEVEGTRGAAHESASAAVT